MKQMMRTPRIVDTTESVQGLLFLEQEYDLFNITIKGYHFWDYIRYGLNERISRYHCPNNDIKKEYNTKYLLKLVKLVSAYWEYIYDVAKTRKRYDIIFINTTERTNPVDGKDVCIYTYPVIKHLSQKYRILLINPFLDNGSIKFNYPCDVIRTRCFDVTNRLICMFQTFTCAEKKSIAHLNAIINEKFDIRIDLNRIAKSIFCWQLRSAHQYFSLFKRCSARIVVYSDNGSMKGIISAAKSLGITTVDLQHALVSEYNILYNYLLAENIRNKIYCPDYILTFGEFWNNNFKLPSRIFPVGFPFHEQMKADLPPSLYEPMNIIILSAGYFPRSVMTKVVLELSNLLPEYTIYYKLRLEEYPIWRDLYPKEFEDMRNLVVVDNNDVSLYEYFSKCNYQVGINSTTIYEGLSFGLVTFIVKANPYQEMKQLYNNGHVFLVSDATEIASMIKNNVKPLKPLLASSVFKGNSLFNIEEILDNIIALQNKGIEKSKVSSLPPRMN